MSRAPLEGPRRPKRPPRRPRWPQDAQDGPKTVKQVPKTLQDSPKRPPKRAPRGQNRPIPFGKRTFSACTTFRFSDAPRRLKTPPRPPQDGPRGPQEAPKRPKRAPRRPKRRPRRPKGAPKKREQIPKDAHRGPQQAPAPQEAQNRPHEKPQQPPRGFKTASDEHSTGLLGPSIGGDQVKATAQPTIDSTKPMASVDIDGVQISTADLLAVSPEQLAFLTDCGGVATTAGGTRSCPTGRWRTSAPTSAWRTGPGCRTSTRRRKSSKELKTGMKLKKAT